MKKNQTFCLRCGLPLVGRADKKYCDDGCRNAYHNARMMDANRICRPYHRSLKQNYGLLAEHLHAGQDVVHNDELLLHGLTRSSRRAWNCCTMAPCATASMTSNILSKMVGISKFGRPNFQPRHAGAVKVLESP